MVLFIGFCLCFVASGQAVMTGEPHAVPPNRTDVRREALFALREFNRDNVQDEFTYKLLNITSAKTQVVAGINYILDVQLGRTLCKKSDSTVAKRCISQTVTKKLQCHFVVTEIPWKNATEVTKRKCG
ncbi:cystatin-like [Lampris incognitus]|uniref:cystatin-like n=1 Tax=Lampris incognitus TaxID=2546036 RepID=UPI0024B4AE7B|nr:cystatin-like [Lampris incognitus]